MCPSLVARLQATISTGSDTFLSVSGAQSGAVGLQQRVKDPDLSATKGGQ